MGFHSCTTNSQYKESILKGRKEADDSLYVGLLLPSNNTGINRYDGVILV